MAITKAFKIGAQNGASGTTLTTGNFDSSGNTHLVVGVKHEGAITTITPSDNKGSTGWSSLTKQAYAPGPDGFVQLHWVKIGTPGASHTVTITLGAARVFRTAIVWCVNADSGDIELDAETTAQSTVDGTAVDAGSLATTGVSVASFMIAGEYAVVTWTPGTGWTEDYDPSGPDNYTGGFSRGAETTSPIDPVATASTAMAWGAAAAAFRELVGGGGAVLRKNSLLRLGVGR